MDSPDLPRQFARTRRFSLGVPRGFTVSPDGARVLFLRSTAGDDPVTRLWLYEDGAERVLADPLSLGAAGPVPEAERIRRERAREASQGVASFATDLHARVAAFALGGALWVVDTGGGAPRRIRTAGPVVDPRPSPDGALVAYVSGGALRVIGVDGTGDRALAEPESEEVTYGLADHVAAESMGRSRGFWWSPASDALLVARVDVSPVQVWWLSDPARPQSPPRAVRYPAAGTANAETSLHIVGTAGGGAGTRVRVDLPERAGQDAAGAGPDDAWTDEAFDYVPTACWDGHGPLITVQTRDQRTLHVLAVDPETGGTLRCGHRHDPAWLELLPGTPVRLANGALCCPRTWRAARVACGPAGRRRPAACRYVRCSPSRRNACGSPRRPNPRRSMSGPSTWVPAHRRPAPCGKSAKGPACTRPPSGAAPWSWTAGLPRGRR